MRKAIVFLILVAVTGMLPMPALAQSNNHVLIKGGTVMTAAKGTLAATDVLIQNGKITKIGKWLTAPAGARVIDATGTYVTPGIINAHSHTTGFAHGRILLNTERMVRFGMGIGEDVLLGWLARPGAAHPVVAAARDSSAGSRATAPPSRWWPPRCTSGAGGAWAAWSCW